MQNAIFSKDPETQSQEIEAKKTTNSTARTGYETQSHEVTGTSVPYTESFVKPFSQKIHLTL